MTKLKCLLVLMSLMTGFVFTPALHAKSTEKTRSNSQFVVLDVKNMSCVICPITIRKALQGVDGVQSAKVDFSSKTAKVIFDPTITNIEALIKTITNVGYPATVHPENNTRNTDVD